MAGISTVHSPSEFAGVMAGLSTGPSAEPEAPSGPLRLIDGLIAGVFAPYTEDPLMDFKLWLGLAIWIPHWIGSVRHHRVLWHGKDRLKMAYCFSINLLVLHLAQYYPANRALMTFFLVCIEEVLPIKNEFLWWYGPQAFDPKRDPMYSQQRYTVFGEQPPPRETVTAVPELDKIPEFSVQADNVYLDIGRRSLRVNITFQSQVLLMCFYAYGVFGRLSEGIENYSFWLAAFASVQMGTLLTSSHESQLGAQWGGRTWAKMLYASDRLPTAKWSMADSSDRVIGEASISPFALRVRCFQSLFINGLCRNFITFSVPLLMMQTDEPMDFVKDCLAVVFITTLDDLGDPRSYSFPGN